MVTPPPAVPPKSVPRAVIVVVSGTDPAYGNVAIALSDRFGSDGVTVLNVQAGPLDLTPDLVSDDVAVIAVGLGAALAVRKAGVRPAYFCQVFNHRPYSLLDSGMHGIDMIPEPKPVLRRWRQTFPNSKTMGIVTGVGHEDRVAAIAATASDMGMEVVHRVVTSDKEAKLAFGKLLHSVDGLWMLPDNRVLSREVLQDVLIQAQNLRKPVLVNTPALLALGAAMTASVHPSEIASLAFDHIQTTNDTASRMHTIDNVEFTMNSDAVAWIQAATDTPATKPSR